MANLVQNPNQFAMTGMLGQVTKDPQPNTLEVMLDPAYAGSVLVSAGCAMKLSPVAGPQIIVTPCTALTDDVFGVVAYNSKRNRYSPAEYMELCCRGNVLLLKSGAAINRGDNVSITNPTVATNDPVCQTETTNLNKIAGVALQTAAAANLLIPVQIAPAAFATAGIYARP